MSYGSGDFRYELVEGWAKLPEGWTFQDACGVAIDKQGRAYVLSRGTHPVMVFDRDGNFLSAWGDGLFQRAHGACIGPDGSIYCTDDELHVVYKFSPEGELLQTLGDKGKPSDTGYVPEWFDFFWSLTTITRSGPPFNRPTGVAVTPAGEIYVSDGYGNARVHKFSPEGRLLLSWGEPGFGPGQFRLPHAVWVDGQERVWVPDRENNRIQIFDSRGKLLDVWPEIVRPCGLCMDAEGNVYVSELCLRLSIYTADGKLITRWGNEGGRDKHKALFLAPHSVAIDSRGDLYVAEVSLTYHGVDKGTNAVLKFVRR